VVRVSQVVRAEVFRSKGGLGRVDWTLGCGCGCSEQKAVAE
jgi:hypothetical protein